MHAREGDDVGKESELKNVGWCLRRSVSESVSLPLCVSVYFSYFYYSLTLTYFLNQIAAVMLVLDDVFLIYFLHRCEKDSKYSSYD